MQDRIVSYWCLPCAEDSARFSTVIAALAEARATPPFRPHLTLGSLGAAADISGIAASLSGLVLEPSGIGVTEAFTMSLFVRFAAKRDLLGVRGMLARMPGSLAGRAFDPHVSLCYGVPPAGSSGRTDVQALLRRPVRFDRLAAVNVTVPVATHEQVAAWQIIQTWPLGPIR